MPPRLTLYLANGSCALVPHAVLLHFGIPVNTVIMKFGPEGVESVDGAISHSEYLKIHPMGYVPALDVDGEIITEVPAILNYISSLVPEANLFSDDDAIGRARVTEWLNFLSGTLHGNGFGMRFRPGRYSDDPEDFDKIRAKGKVVVGKCYTRINSRLEGRLFAVGVSLTAADFYLYIFSRWGKELGFDMETEFPNYSAFARRAEGFTGIKKAIMEENLDFNYCN